MPYHDENLDRADRWFHDFRSPPTPEEAAVMQTVLDNTTYRFHALNQSGDKPHQILNVGALILPVGRDGTAWDDLAHNLTPQQWSRVLLRALLVYGPRWRPGAVMALPVYLEQMVPLSVYAASDRVLGLFGDEDPQEHFWWWLTEPQNTMDHEALASLEMQIDARLVEPIAWDAQKREFGPWPKDPRVRAVWVESLWWEWDWRVTTKRGRVDLLQRLRALAEEARARNAHVFMDTLDTPDRAWVWQEAAAEFGVGWIGAPNADDVDLAFRDRGPASHAQGLVEPLPELADRPEPPEES